MAYREFSMLDVKEILRHRIARHGARQVERDAGFHRKTVTRYYQAAEELGIPLDRAPTDEEIHLVAQRVQARPILSASDEWKELLEHRERISAWLSQPRPLRLTKVHDLLVRNHNVSAGYDTLRRFAKKEVGWHKKQPTVRLAETAPGELAQVDFGQMSELVDDTGKRRKLHALIVTLCFSRYQFVWPTLFQTTEAICEGLEQAWRFFGAMPKVLLPDNMTGMIDKADDLAPVFVPAFLDYIQHRNLFVDPARVRSPKDKARVENQVPYVRESCFDGEVFGSLADARAHAAWWCRDVAGARIHGTTKKVPREVFNEQERAAMLPARSEPYDVPRWLTVKRQPDNHVHVLNALYSVPRDPAVKKYRVRVDSKLVAIYAGTKVVRSHARVADGERSTHPDDYPPGKEIIATRNAAALVAEAKAAGHHIGVYAERLLDVPLPWTRMRMLYTLLDLCHKYGSGRVEAVCQSALSFDVVDVSRIKGMLERAQKPGSPSDASSRVVPLVAPRFARSSEQFATRKATGQEGA